MGFSSVFVEMDFVSVCSLLKFLQPDPVSQVGSTSFILTSKIGTELMFIGVVALWLF